ncbi:nucleotide-binding universal stress UspA family protein [Nocardioides salarius]|uniref:Nucleotide-binding universal stress UspA family protein n=1 Tax=Nocardioides salarius TaxID=374513 RepID=A0ABS2M591_9ACTN|nr:universal stress protein [Nocardioides salarius]MBM7506355.1 nucleotide-binding universal stress UspA family protein [Nocardioides salarius]
MSQPTPHPVVVALGEQPADAALAFAVDEARRRGCGVHLLHVVHALPQGPEMVLVQSVDVEAIGRRSLREAFDLCRGMAGETIPVTGRLLLGTVVHELVDAVADLEAARMVVLQHRDLSRVRRLVSRSTTSGLAARLHVPLVSVPTGWVAPPDDAAPGLVTAGVDVPHRSDAVLRAAVDAARARGARLELVHSWSLPGLHDDPSLARVHGESIAVQEAEEIRDRLVELGLDLDGLEVEVRTPQSPAAERLVEASEASSLLVVGKHDPMVPLGSHVGPVAGAVLREAQCPVMLVDPHRPG